MDKKQRQFDKALSDAKSKQDDAQAALEMAIKETRMAEVEAAKLKEDLEDTTDSYDKVMKKNKKLHEEINDLQHTVQESSRNIHELEKEKRSGGFSKRCFICFYFLMAANQSPSFEHQFESST